MSKFLDKKEQVFDIKLTSYGHYLMSIGKFKPHYYAFYDDNILYDKKYAHSTATENQNDIDKRIKSETQYIESLVLFRDVEETLNNGAGASDWYNQDAITSRQMVPSPDAFVLNAPIGDAYLEGNSNVSPAWKIVSLQSKIETVNQTDEANNSIIPQINITATYNLMTQNVFDGSETFVFDDMRNAYNQTLQFNDEKIIKLENSDVMLFVDEINTQLLTRNFDIEIFRILSSSNAAQYEQLERKYFNSVSPQIKDGFLISPNAQQINTDFDTSHVEYYFDVLTDMSVNKNLACKGARYVNKKTYYVGLDFDCEEVQQENAYNDIYGSVTEPEICLD